MGRRPSLATAHNVPAVAGNRAARGRLEEAVTAMGAYIAHRVQIGDLKAPALEVDDE